MAILDFSYQNCVKLHERMYLYHFLPIINMLCQNHYLEASCDNLIKLNGYFCRKGLFTPSTFEALLSVIRVRIKPFKELSHLA